MKAKHVTLLCHAPFLYYIQWKQASKIGVHYIKFYLTFACGGFSFRDLEVVSCPFMHIGLIYSAANDTGPCIRERIFQSELQKRCRRLPNDSNPDFA